MQANISSLNLQLLGQTVNHLNFSKLFEQPVRLYFPRRESSGQYAILNHQHPSGIWFSIITVKATI